MPERMWFFARNNQQEGPIPESQLQQLFVNNTLVDETLVWSDHLSSWTPASQIDSFATSANTATQQSDVGSALGLSAFGESAPQTSGNGDMSNHAAGSDHNLDSGFSSASTQNDPLTHNSGWASEQPITDTSATWGTASAASEAVSQSDNQSLWGKGSDSASTAKSDDTSAWGGNTQHSDIIPDTGHDAWAGQQKQPSEQETAKAWARQQQQQHSATSQSWAGQQQQPSDTAQSGGGQQPGDTAQAWDNKQPSNDVAPAAAAQTHKESGPSWGVQPPISDGGATHESHSAAQTWGNDASAIEPDLNTFPNWGNPAPAAATAGTEPAWGNAPEPTNMPDWGVPASQQTTSEPSWGSPSEAGTSPGTAPMGAAGQTNNTGFATFPEPSYGGGLTGLGDALASGDRPQRDPNEISQSVKSSRSLRKSFGANTAEPPVTTKLVVNKPDYQPPAAVQTSSALVGTADEPGAPHPWYRYWARGSDFWFASIFSTLVSAPFAAPAASTGNILWAVLSIPLSLAAFMVYEPVLLALTGTTLGKLLWGISVKHTDGTKLTFPEAAKRTWLVFLRSGAILSAIPIVNAVGWIANIVIYVMQMTKLNENSITSWDKEMELAYVHQPLGVVRIIAIAVVFLSFIGAIVAAILFAAATLATAFQAIGTSH